MKIGEFNIELENMVYEPSDDSFLLIDNLNINPGEKVLEIGTGSGIVAMYASKVADEVVATDINFNAIEIAEKNFLLNNIDNINILFGDLFEPLKSEGFNEKFDVILFNTPYLPTENDEVLEDDLNYAFDGGLDGRKIIDPFLNQVKNHLNKNGRVQLIQSSLSNIEQTLLKLEELGFLVEITASEKFFFEEIVLITGFLD
ncbi:putative methyltransferase [Methanobrevibacter arboriphilus JCM 13429 = DSM 1125]|uniref:Putative methyltransferase n=1 Tax=Methanobrevibacter arboriphilus JCM 13429 = DSM 1125 TaxID=1300164 RepID=A0A1V6N442_METAZ|nr:HemK2/MTQ2 family protein methyltransferase [Methanobrevibacter arboriphilus]OQD59468.1 putative methyltransferase [Methanobrevibacter arboriphilus JCM 13429 = DSM 1125]